MSDIPNLALIKGAVFEPYSIKALMAGGTFTVYYGGGKPLQPMTAYGVQLQAGMGDSWHLILSNTERAEIPGPAQGGAAGPSGVQGGAAGTAQDTRSRTAAAQSSIERSPAIPRVKKHVEDLRNAVQEKWDGEKSLFVVPSIQNFPVIDAVRLPSMVFQVKRYCVSAAD